MGKLTVIFPMGSPKFGKTTSENLVKLGPISQLMDVMIPWLHQLYHINNQDMVISCDISCAQK